MPILYEIYNLAAQGMGDYSKAKRKLGWQPKVKFEELVKIMVKADWGDVAAGLLFLPLKFQYFPIL